MAVTTAAGAANSRNDLSWGKNSIFSSFLSLWLKWSHSSFFCPSLGRMDPPKRLDRKEVPLWDLGTLAHLYTNNMLETKQYSYGTIKYFSSIYWWSRKIAKSATFWIIAVYDTKNMLVIAALRTVLTWATNGPLFSAQILQNPLHTAQNWSWKGGIFSALRQRGPSEVG